jgi:hypothetical protein
MSLWGITDIASFGGKLVALSPDEGDPTAHATDLSVVDDNTLRISGGSGYGSPGETVRYERDADGQVRRVWIGGSAAMPQAQFARYVRGLGSAVRPAWR